MDKQTRIKDEIEKTLNLLENMEELKSNPYLYTRIKSELDSPEYKQKTKAKNESLITRLIPAFIVLLIIINLYSIIDLTSPDVKGETQISRAEYLQEISNDYMLNPSSYYPIIAE